MKYINIHTHNPSKEKNRFEIINCFPEQIPDEGQYCSIGLHPWFIKNLEDDSWYNNMKEKLNDRNVIAIGETGLDKLISIDYNAQKQVFEKHIELSREKRLPVFIHCVRAYSDILWYKKQLKDPSIWIIHGFSENLHIANELIKHGCYLSFGKVIFTNKKIQGYFNKIAINRIFLETDDELGYAIEEVYQQASTLLKISIVELKQQIYYNFEQIFPGILKNERLATKN